MDLKNFNTYVWKICKKLEKYLKIEKGFEKV
jgi:hypothetical protein